MKVHKSSPLHQFPIFKHINNNNNIIINDNKNNNNNDVLLVYCASKLLM